MRADKDKITRLLKTSRGQIDGVLKMIDEDKYCIDIANQIMASEAVLKKAVKEILRAHIEGCVYSAFADGCEAEKEKKIDELIAVFDKMTK
ncbi:MAG: metal-sensing transcriptional repressor [Bacillota bacterium]|nr:metal-sensing transcriptional repressor [Bacillota bacterium]